MCFFVKAVNAPQAGNPSPCGVFLQRQMEDEARAKQFRARQFNPTMFSGVQQPRARRSEPARNSGGRCSFGGGRPVTAPKPPVNRPDQRHSYRQEILEGEFSNDATMARRAMVLAREVCFIPDVHFACSFHVSTARSGPPSMWYFHSLSCCPKQ